MCVYRGDYCGESSGKPKDRAPLLKELSINSVRKCVEKQIYGYIPFFVCVCGSQACAQRGAQMRAVLDHALATSCAAQRRRLRLARTVVVPVGTSLRLCDDPASARSLADVESLRRAALDPEKAQHHADAPRLRARRHRVF